MKQMIALWSMVKVHGLMVADPTNLLVSPIASSVRFSGRAALRRVKRFSTTPPRWAHRLATAPCDVKIYDAVGTSRIIYPRRGRALREAPSREASRRRKPKFNLRRDARPELARRAVDRRGPETEDARSCDVARRGAARAARRGTASSVNKFHFYTRHETRP